MIFKEIISSKLWIGIILITILSLILSVDDINNLKFSYGQILILLATVCWGFVNNCTKMISSKDTFSIVILKGIFSGFGLFIIALLINEKIPIVTDILKVLLLGFVAYGLSIFLYVKAQYKQGAFFSL